MNFDLGGDASRIVASIRRANATAECDLDGTILSANANFVKLFGYSEVEVIGRNAAMLAPKSTLDSSDYRAIWEGIISGKPYFGEMCQIRKDGQEVWVFARFNPIFRRDKPYKAFIFATDVTETRARRAHFESQLQAVNRMQAVIEFALDGTVIDANENFLSAFDYALDDIRGKHHRMFVEPQDASSTEYRHFWDKLRQGQVEAAVFRRVGKGGKTVWIRASYNPLFDPSGRVSSIIKFATDITPAKLAQLERQEAQERVNSGVRDIAEAVASTNQQATSAAVAAVEASANVNAVAAGSAQLSSSVTEINSQVMKALDISNEAVSQANQAGATVASLVEDARKISMVVDLISQIAAQTNLLALNATIEAARAGEAGRGFAVVAGEVKSLAAQTAKATGDISAHIMAVQASSQLAQGAIDAINKTISAINGISISISAAVEEQAAVTSDMSHNMQEAARGVEMITGNMETVAKLTRRADDGIRDIVEAAKKAV